MIEIDFTLKSNLNGSNKEIEFSNGFIGLYTPKANWHSLPKINLCSLNTAGDRHSGVCARALIL